MISIGIPREKKVPVGTPTDTVTEKALFFTVSQRSPKNAVCTAPHTYIMSPELQFMLLMGLRENRFTSQISSIIVVNVSKDSIASLNLKIYRPKAVYSEDLS